MHLQSKIVCPLEFIVETQPQLQPALLSLFAAQSFATTIKRFGAVSSVVERLVYTDNRMIFSHYSYLV